MDGIILKDDARYDHTENYLKNRGCTFHPPSINPGKLNFAIFPFKEKVDEAIFDNKYFASLDKNVQIFSGVANAYLAEKCTRYRIAYHVMMDDVGTKVKNAVPTSEGVIAYLIRNLGRTVARSRVLVIGYGVCGRDLALRLTALGANVHALVRNREKECTAFTDSVTPIYLHDILGQACKRECNFDAIVNTVPGQVFTNEMLVRMGSTILIDIASAPYGFDMEFAKTLNAKSALLPGIPGKYATQTAGEILGEYVEIVLNI